MYHCNLWSSCICLVVILCHPFRCNKRSSFTVFFRLHPCIRVSSAYLNMIQFCRSVLILFITVCPLSYFFYVSFRLFVIVFVCHCVLLLLYPVVSVPVCQCTLSVYFCSYTHFASVPFFHCTLLLVYPLYSELFRTVGDWKVLFLRLLHCIL